MVALAALTHLVATSSSSTTIPQVVQQAAHKASSGGGSLLTPFAVPLAWILAGIYSIIPDYGVAILGLSLLWMLIISPLTLKSTRSMLAMQKLQPELKKLQAKHKDDRQAFAQAQMDLFREHNVSPFGSCLPMLLPLPVFFALFRLIDGLSSVYTYKVHALNGSILSSTAYTTPKFLDQGTKMYKSIVASHGQLEAFGMNLAKSPLAHHSGVISAAPYWIAILIMAGTSYLQTSMMQTRNQAAYQANPQMRMMKFLAPAFALICIRFPVGVIVYYATSNICRILQQDAMYRFDPKVKALVDQELEEVEEHTLEIDEQQRNRPGYTPPRGAKPPPQDKRQPVDRPAKPGGSPAQGGRSRFRDLLQAAAEEQERKRRDKAGGDSAPKSSGNGSGTGAKGSVPKGSVPKGAGNGSGGTGSSGARVGGNGSARPGGGPGGAAPGGGQGGSRPRPSGSKTNRKRRGR
jgi:YidC/Oxa1 family membrane protein insertase